jgi:hypothetical protein
MIKSAFFNSAPALWLRPCFGLAFGALISSCSSLKEVGQEAEPKPPVSVTVNETERSLLEMPFDAAVAISPQNSKIGELFQVAADNIEVLKTDREGQPVKVRASGHVFLEMALSDRVTALCDEATLTLTEVTLKGKPMVMKGDRVARATEPGTTLWLTETRIKVTGGCELAKLETPAYSTPGMLLANSDFFPVPEPVLPPITQPWDAADMNGLLPALTMTTGSSTAPKR